MLAWSCIIFVCRPEPFKGALSRIISVSLRSQNAYLCHGKPTNNGLFLLTIAKIEAKLFQLFPRDFKKIDINGRGLFSLCELKLYLPLDVQR